MFKVMSAAKPKPSLTSHGEAGATYRGIRLRATGGGTRFTLDQIRQAVEAAVVKNADALARKA